jgi:hypothetical protein
VVRGLEFFRRHFREHADRYVLIGGTACDLAMNAAGVEFRATKDLDIVLRVEALDAAFAEAFWAFVRAGGYRLQEAASGRTQFYRFQKPAAEGYPFMLELFSRAPDALKPAAGSHLTPIPMGGEVSSLSAILLDEDYYRFLHAGRREADGIPFVGPEHLIALKARAWLDLSVRKLGGEAVDSRGVRKHRNDVFRLYLIADPGLLGEVPERIKADMKEFVSRMRGEEIDCRALGLGAAGLGAALEGLARIYGL